MSSLRTARRTAHFAVGAAATLVLWAFGHVPTYRRNRSGDEHEGVSTGPGTRPPDPAQPWPGDPERLQRWNEGVGALWHRRYWIDMTDADHDEASLLSMVLDDLPSVIPGELSVVERLDGSADRPPQIGDELLVRLPGPWNGPVRLVARDRTSFRLATLQGHLEAGEIEFRTSRTERGLLRFEIESWARSGDRLFDVLYDRLVVGREIQVYLWSRLCERVARKADAVVMSNVQVHTARLEGVDGWARLEGVDGWARLEGVDG